MAASMTTSPCGQTLNLNDASRQSPPRTVSTASSRRRRWRRALPAVDIRPLSASTGSVSAMPRRLSRHAIDEAGRRKIPLALLETVLTAPDQIAQLDALLAVYQSRVADDTGKVYLIRAIVSTETTPGIVVT